ncbi:MAG: hypothetical protein RSE59_05340, partial [Clostridia bacterium]
MSNEEKILEMLTQLTSDFSGLKEGQKSLEEGQKSLEEGQKALDAKINTVHKELSGQITMLDGKVNAL